MRALPVVGVLGSGRERHESLALPLGRMLGELGCHLLTGGGGGVMEAVAEGFVAVEGRKGVSIGVLPGRLARAECEAPEGYPNPFVELAIRTHLPARGTEGETLESRNYLNVLTAWALVFLPGGEGTAAEARLARRFGAPAIGLAGGGVAQGIPQADSVEEAERFLRAVL